jgi:hypothetical protein
MVPLLGAWRCELSCLGGDRLMRHIEQPAQFSPLLFGPFKPCFQPLKLFDRHEPLCDILALPCVTCRFVMRFVVWGVPQNQESGSLRPGLPLGLEAPGVNHPADLGP